MQFPAMFNLIRHTFRAREKLSCGLTGEAKGTSQTTVGQAGAMINHKFCYSHWNGFSRCQTEQAAQTISFMGALRDQCPVPCNYRQTVCPLPAFSVHSEENPVLACSKDRIYSLALRAVTDCFFFCVLVNFILFSFETMTISRRKRLFQLTDELNAAGLRCRL